MLGESVSDPEGVEEGGSIRGMELLPVATQLKKNKIRCQTEGVLPALEGIFSHLSGLKYRGYEIHMGRTLFTGCSFGGQAAGNGGEMEERWQRPVVWDENPNVYGTYIHGIFDRGDMAATVIDILAEKKGIKLESGGMEDYQSFKEKQYDKLADTLRQHLNMEDVYGMLREAHLE